MKKFLLIILAVGFLLVASGIFYYFVIVLPGIQKQEVDIKQQEFIQKQLQSDQKKTDLDNCLLQAKMQQKKDAQILQESMAKIGCHDSAGNVVETKGCMSAFVQSFDELKLDYLNAEAACYSRFN